jgi:hypothetical protein
MQDILDHADELAARFESYDPSPDDDVGVAGCLLRRAVKARRLHDRSTRVDPFIAEAGAERRRIAFASPEQES